MLLGALLGGCSESLPTRLAPQSPLSISRVLVSQGTAAGGIRVGVTIEVRNDYEETFDGDVDIRANTRIWWVDHPGVEANVALRQQGHVRLDPGRTYILRQEWPLRTDDGRDVLSLLDYSALDVRYGVLYARPEIFAVQVTLTLFDQTGLLTSSPQEFTLQGWRVYGQDAEAGAGARLAVPGDCCACRPGAAHYWRRAPDRARGVPNPTGQST